MQILIMHSLRFPWTRRYLRHTIIFKLARALDDIEERCWLCGVRNPALTAVENSAFNMQIFPLFCNIQDFRSNEDLDKEKLHIIIIIVYYINRSQGTENSNRT